MTYRKNYIIFISVFVFMNVYTVQSVAVAIARGVLLSLRTPQVTSRGGPRSFLSVGNIYTLPRQIGECLPNPPVPKSFRRVLSRNSTSSTPNNEDDQPGYTELLSQIERIRGRQLPWRVEYIGVQPQCNVVYRRVHEGRSNRPCILRVAGGIFRGSFPVKKFLK